MAADEDDVTHDHAVVLPEIEEVKFANKETVTDIDLILDDQQQLHISRESTKVNRPQSWAAKKEKSQLQRRGSSPSCLNGPDSTRLVDTYRKGRKESSQVLKGPHVQSEDRKKEQSTTNSKKKKKSNALFYLSMI